MENRKTRKLTLHTSGEGLDNRYYSLRKRLQGLDDILTGKRLFLTEDYVQGRVGLLFHFAATCNQHIGHSNHFLHLVVSAKADVGNSAAQCTVWVADGCARDGDHGGHWNQNNVLIGNVEGMKSHEGFIPIGSRVRTYLIQDDAHDFFRGVGVFGGQLGLNIRPGFPDGELGVLSGRLLVEFGQNAVEVVESGAKIVNCIPQNCGDMSGEVFEYPLLENAWAGFGKVMGVTFRKKPMKYRLQLVNVMFGTLDLEDRSVEAVGV